IVTVCARVCAMTCESPSCTPKHECPSCVLLTFVLLFYSHQCCGSRCDNVVAIPLHCRPDLIEACADLVNSEWQRSRGARIHALQKSCDDFPVCLVLLSKSETGECLLGHARLSLVVGQSRSLFVESVVVSRELRGKGYGRKLMEATERYARARGFRRLYLTTHDKQHFYAHLGYTLGEPVQSAGLISTFMPMEILQRFSQPPSCGLPDSNQCAISSSFRPSPAPTNVTTTAPLPPPPPVPPSLKAPQADRCTLLETVFRDMKGQPIFWMKKDL
uniref:N-alpha-acetyltransferase 80 n=1 Tax=Erpetoichthys calabaricus TaxID=27687 RepID=A0A8C4TKR6_ERPCA